MTDYVIRPLGPDTWDAFAGLAERHNGVWNAVHGSCWAEGGGCWCMRFQRSCAPKQPGDGNRGLVRVRVLYSGTRNLFEQAGLEFVRRKGKYHCVMRIVL